MQTSELEKKKNNLLGDEECINFRPSPNFKHMKKYLKSKFEEANSSPNQSSDQSTTPNSEEHDSVKPQQASSSSMAQRVQPPLPPNSPPLLVPKQEVEDEEYNDRSATQPHQKVENVDVPKKDQKTTMCREFARDNCTRGAACIYAHELILSQLPGVYTFCKNFQNTKCNLPKCKFVHASVFEKEHFYRTGFLPPHTLSHLKESKTALGPFEGTSEPVQVFPFPPPTMNPKVYSAGTNNGAQVDGSGRPTAEMFPANPAAALRHGSPAKRDWNHLEPMAAREHDNSEPMQKKCKTCDVNELRLQYTMTKLKKAKELAEINAKKKIYLLKCETRMNHVFDMIKSKPDGIGSSLSSVLGTGINLRNEKEPQVSIMEKLSMLLQVSNRMNVLGNSQEAVLDKILNLLQKDSECRTTTSPNSH